MIRKIAAVVAVGAAALVVAGAIGTTAFLLGPLPSRRGQVVLPRLSAPVTARFDRQGVPHIRAVLELDAWRALGFLHAADRMFQMEIRRRAAAGRLAEIFGAVALPSDREARVNGYSALALRDWETVRSGERAVLEAYADGVNAFLSGQTPPLELRALSLTPEPWTPVDSLAFGRLMQDRLCTADGPERGAFDDARRRGVTAAAALLAAEEPGASPIDPEVARVLADLPRATSVSRLDEDPAPAGSNAWALAGSRTASGKPLLAGDPHLAPERPGVWYASHLTSADGVDVVGLTLAGLPGIVIGHNGRVAWSLTMHQADDSDFYVEQIDWNKGLYRRGDSWEPLERTSETIHVKGAPDETVDVARTIHGPIVERIDDAKGFALARAFAPADLPQGPRAFLEAAHAQNGGELVAAWAQFAGPSVNVCWADTSGGVGLKVAGAIPQRRSGTGRFPAPGWVEAYDWAGTIPADALPAIARPGESLVATANDDWRASGWRLPYPGVFAEPDRAERARALASSLHQATVADMRVMQTDVYSSYAARVVAAIRALKLADPRAVRAAAVLSSWDAHADVRGPSRLFFAFIKEARNEAGASGARVTWPILERMLEGTGAQAFWDDPSTPAVEMRRDRIERALALALVTVEREDGPDPTRWFWGGLHRLVYKHLLAGALPATVARRLDYGPVALPGEWHTLAVAGFPLRGPSYDVIDAPSARLIVDLGNPDASRLVLPLGQSGQLFDRHAQDQLRAWSTGRDFPLPFTTAAVDAATISTVRFVPGD